MNFSNKMAKTNVIKAKDLANKMVEKFNLTKKEANDILNFLTEEIVNNLKSGNQVKIVGLGTFKVKEKKARVAINPKTGEKIQVPAKKVPRFTPSKDLKAVIQ